MPYATPFPCRRTVAERLQPRKPADDRAGRIGGSGSFSDQPDRCSLSGACESGDYVREGGVAACGSHDPRSRPIRAIAAGPA